MSPTPCGTRNQAVSGRLSAQYHSSCGEKLTVTSLLRPRDRQPANSVAHSVHPTGMAIDLRIPSSQKCRAWLERTLLSLEKQHVVEATWERYPPHYHVAVLARALAPAAHCRRVRARPRRTWFAGAIRRLKSPPGPASASRNCELRTVCGAA